MKYASGYHRLKAKYDILEIALFHEKSYSKSLVKKLDEITFENKCIVESQKKELMSCLKRNKDINDLNEAQSKLIKVLAFGWVVFIVAFLIFLFTF